MATFIAEISMTNSDKKGTFLGREELLRRDILTGVEVGIFDAPRSGDGRPSSCGRPLRLCLHDDAQC